MARHLIVPGDCAHLSSNRTAGPGSMWGKLESRYPPFESRVRSHGLRADADLSSIIEENIPESEDGADS